MKGGAEPSFGTFFSSAPALAGQDIYVLNNTTGTWDKVAEPGTVSMKRGEAFWVYCKGSSTFTGPLAVQPSQSGGLQFGTTLSEQELVVRNDSDATMEVELVFSDLNSHLYYWTFSQAQNRAVWEPFPTSLVLSLAARSSQAVRIGIRRAGLTAGAPYEANLSVSQKDQPGMELLVPLGVTGIGYSGLWVGNASITEVNEPANAAQPDKPVKTGSEFSFRLIVHVDQVGTARLLDHVTQMWQEGTWKPDPLDPGKLVVDDPGYFVLVANDARIPDYSGSALLDGRPVGRRISAPAFPRIPPDERTLGTLNPTPGSTLSGTITLAADDPTNPFLHLYHPDHRQASQSRQVVRDITLTFSDTDAAGNPIPGIFEMTKGSTQLGGIYEETIWGLHKQQLKIRGTFLLHRVSEVDTLVE
ncbi:MAG: hypothetical protein JRJ83_13190 [Deltaproteobacteria bacterium]|nr:hypothetical protein [Deltaproteobacteria bacterium]